MMSPPAEQGMCRGFDFPPLYRHINSDEMCVVFINI